LSSTGETYSLDKWVRSGHITGAVNVPTLSAMKEDKAYKDVETLKAIYESAAITP
jgi:3-mercaptopyruvate sulfurtransferase SseA